MIRLVVKTINITIETADDDQEIASINKTEKISSA